MVSPSTAWDRLREANQNRSAQPATHPVAALFRCCDAQQSSDARFGPHSALIEVSTWGHTIDASVLASIEYAVEAMEVPLIIVLGHDDCTAMRAALHAWESAELPSGAMRAAVEHALLSVVHRGTAAGTVESITTAHIAQTGLLLVQRSPIVARLVDAEKLGVVCATYDDVERRFRLHATVGIIGEDTHGLVECV